MTCLEALKRRIASKLIGPQRVADAFDRRLRPGQLVVLESTTYPGTTREEKVLSPA